MKRLGAMLMLAAMPGFTQAQTMVCVPRTQAAALVTFALPSLVERLADRCRANLPPNAYLSVNAMALADRYRPDAAAAWPEARRAIARVFAQFLGQPMPADMNSDLIRTLAEPALAELLAKQVSPRDCQTADEAITDAAALSGRDVGRLAALAATIADRKGKGIAGILSICPSGSVAP
ncbi:hypothetical protein [Sphingomonas nostoxanthinifaciens]|uniref:hypothetical protein n=1 Tax=Sphingomonas nostoxanthinifaciens TaxID=2872652 RepID=UPI001CC1E2DC|nr:hypothetical protein [Sphingomonas nostoxanthinifaciens]UAK22884.1 hypothetical protein K8P63_10570 [Sphingomonas nostoxanthinifaciens]